MANISVSNINKVFENNFQALYDVTFNSNENEFIVIVGPSGCGKSTLLRVIAGLEQTTSGQILVNDVDVTSFQPKKRDISMVFQNYALYPHMTVFDNIAFPLKLHKIPKKEIKIKVEKVAEMLDLKELLKRKPGTLSGGQCQRVAIGRAIIREPQIFLFDEPLSNLDADLREYTRVELKKLHNELKTVFLYVTHDQIEALTMGDRIIVMKSGKVQQFDTPENIYNKPNNVFVAKFIGSPKMNFVSKEFAEKLSGSVIAHQNVKVGVRPEHINIDKITSKDCTGIVSSIELLGKDILVAIDYGGKDMLIVSKPSCVVEKINVGDSVLCSVCVECLHVFDKKTSQRLN